MTAQPIDLADEPSRAVGELRGIVDEALRVVLEMIALPIIGPRFAICQWTHCRTA